MPEIEQLSLMAHTRHGDPETSHRAAASVQRIRESQAAILRLFGTLGPMHDQRLIINYQRAGVMPTQSESGIRTRRSELVERGSLRDSGRRVRLPSGRQSIVWEPNPPFEEA